MKLYSTFFGLTLTFVCTLASVSADVIREEHPVRVNQAWSLQNYPNPFKEPNECQMSAPGYICDPDVVLELEEATKLKNSIDGLNENLQNYCGGKGKNGFDFGVAIMEKIDIPANKNALEHSREFADGLLKKWGLGGDCGNGLMLLSANGQKILTFSLGNTTEHVLKNSTIESLKSAVNQEIKDTDNVLRHVMVSVDALRNGLPLINKEKAINKAIEMANSNPQLSTVLRNVHNRLEQLELEESKTEMTIDPSNNGRFGNLHGGLLIAYFFGFVLCLTVICFVLGVLLKRRANSQATPRATNTSFGPYQTTTTTMQDTKYRTLQQQPASHF